MRSTSPRKQDREGEGAALHVGGQAEAVEKGRAACGAEEEHGEARKRSREECGAEEEIRGKQITKARGSKDKRHQQLGQEEGCNIPDEEEGVADEPEDPICFMGALSRGPSVDIGAEFEIGASS